MPPTGTTSPRRNEQQIFTCNKMKTPRKQSRTERHEQPNRIEVAFVERERSQKIRMLVNAVCAAHGGIARMTLSDWCAAEAETTQQFANELRMHRCRLATS